MRVFVCSSSLVPCPPTGYGSERMVFVLARELAREGHEVLLCAPPSMPRRRYEELGITILPIPRSYGSISYVDEEKCLEWYYSEARKSDAVLDASATCINHEELHWRFPHLPHACWRNGLEFVHPRVGRHNIVVLSELAKRCAVEGVSAWKGSPWEELFDSPPGRYPTPPRVVPYGLPLEEFEPVYQKDDYFVWVSRFHPAKGVFEVLRLAKAMPSKRFVLAGSTQFKDHRRWFERVRDFASTLPNVALVPDPSEEEKKRLIARAKAFIYPLQYREAFGLVILEALALGTPVLTHSKWVTPELRPAVMELTPESLELVDREGVRYEALRAFVAASFSSRHMARRWLEVLRDVARGAAW